MQSNSNAVKRSRTSSASLAWIQATAGGIEPLTTLNHTLRRDCSVTAGTGAAATAFKAVEWMSLSQDVWRDSDSGCVKATAMPTKETCCANTFGLGS